MTDKNLFDLLGISLGASSRDVTRIYNQQIQKLTGGIAELNTELEDPGLSVDTERELRNLLGHRKRRLTEFEKALKDLLENPDKRPGYHITVNYNQTVQQLIRAGKYSSSEGITDANFPSDEEGTARLEIFLLSFDSDNRVSSEGAIKAMKKQGLRPATLKELLALGAAYPYPDLQRVNSIIAFGSTWRGHSGSLGVPFLGRSASHLLIRLCWFKGGDWRPSVRFAAVRKQL